MLLHARLGRVAPHYPPDSLALGGAKMSGSGSNIACWFVDTPMLFDNHGCPLSTADLKFLKKVATRLLKRKTYPKHYATQRYLRTLQDPERNFDGSLVTCFCDDCSGLTIQVAPRRRG